MFYEPKAYTPQGIGRPKKECKRKCEGFHTPGAKAKKRDRREKKKLSSSVGRDSMIGTEVDTYPEVTNLLPGK